MVMAENTAVLVVNQALQPAEDEGPVHVGKHACMIIVAESVMWQCQLWHCESSPAMHMSAHTAEVLVIGTAEPLPDAWQQCATRDNADDRVELAAQASAHLVHVLHHAIIMHSGLLRLTPRLQAGAPESCQGPAEGAVGHGPGCKR